MLKLTGPDGKVWEVRWYHPTQADAEKIPDAIRKLMTTRPPGFPVPNQLGTFCVCTSEDSTLYGTARLSQSDQFCRIKGRELSFGRAIRAFSKNDRIPLWQQFNRSLPDRKKIPLTKITKFQDPATGKWCKRKVKIEDPESAPQAENVATTT